MKILIANPGSTSYKCKLFDMTDETILFQAAVERIGDQESPVSWQFGRSDKKKKTLTIPDYITAVNQISNILQQKYSMNEIAAVGFKTVHAKDVTGCVELTKDVLDGMKAYTPLVPVHNTVYLTAIEAFENVLPNTPRIGLFETHFHQHMPAEAAMYGVPYDWIEKHGVRKYGFHGASHRYIAERAKSVYDADKIISCHLGGSASVCAIRDGKSIDTSMGMSAQCGLINAKRVGDLDSFALLYIMEKEKLSVEQMRDCLISRAGLLGLSGLSGDLRDIQEAMDQNPKAELAFKTFAYGVKRYIGEYLAVLNSADVIVFTGGAGQHSSRLRREILKNMNHLGIVLDQDKNQSNPEEGLISADISKIKIAVIPTNEELIVAREVARRLA
ncbi:acetate/propionate family kinase [bacterium]|nr:acetate/propionate family kinase [bacterium]